MIYKKERDMRRALAKHLSEQGKNPRQEVPCLVGNADIVDDECIYELKLRCNEKNLCKAVGQIMRYTWGTEKKPMIVFNRFALRGAKALNENNMARLASFGITVWLFDHEGLRLAPVQRCDQL